jgi:hypothetical protein
MKGIFDRLISKVHTGTATRHPELQSARKQRLSKKKEDEMSSMPSDEE